MLLDRNEMIVLEIEGLKRRVINADRAGADSWRQISFLYRAADRFSRRVFAGSYCHLEQDQTGCATGACCQCRPDVFAYEKSVLDLLPKRVDNSGYCPFFNLTKRNCGIYQMRPFACRVYYNLARSSYYCQNPNDRTLQIFDGVRRHLERILGPYQGGYQPSPSPSGGLGRGSCHNRHCRFSILLSQRAEILSKSKLDDSYDWIFLSGNGTLSSD